MFDLGAYLERLGLGPDPGLVELHRAQVATIPFENLDPHAGMPVSLAIEDLQRKLVTERRGGYCFEQNLLLAAALQALGAEVEPMLARVRFGAPPGTVRPRGHLVLRVRWNGASWLADAGFGFGTPLEPVPFRLGSVHEQAGWCFRLVASGDELMLQTLRGADWLDVYGFVPQPVLPIDIEVSNWFTATHPRSPFVTGLFVGAQTVDGMRTVLNDWKGLTLTEQTPERTTVTPVAREAVPQLLQARFGLPGFTLDGAGRVVRAVGAASATSRGAATPI